MSIGSVSTTRLARCGVKCDRSIGTITSSPPITIRRISSVRTISSSRVTTSFGVLQPVLIDVALEARLFPAAAARAARFLALDDRAVHAAVQREHEDARGVGVGDERREARELIAHERQRIQKRYVRQMQLMPWKRRLELQRLEQAAGRAGEDRDAVGLAPQFLLQILLDARDVPLERRLDARMAPESAYAIPQLVLDEPGKTIAAAFIGLRIQIQTDDRSRGRLHAREPMQQLVELRINHGHLNLLV